MSESTTFRRGLAAALIAYVIWGLLPLYFKALHAVPPLEADRDRLPGERGRHDREGEHARGDDVDGAVGPHQRLGQPGEVRSNSKARLIRDGAAVADNLTIAGLRRFKDDATEVREGFECGINLGNYQDVKVDDVIETFEMREKPRKP